MEVADLQQKCLSKIVYMQQRLRGDFPHITRNGKWLTNKDGHWTGGFWAGMLWLRAWHEANGEEQKAAALEQALALAVRRNDNKTHDMGFIFGPSCVFGNHVAPDERLVRMAVAGAYNMLDLFDPGTGLILAWDEPGYEGTAIVDTIMNVPLMLWASTQEDDPQLRETALMVSDRIMQHHVRDDASIYHVVRWDTTSHEIVERTTHQGHTAESCWSRGQAWALYGFANVYRYTTRQTYLDVSQRLAEYFWAHLDTRLCLPRWDFCFRDHEEEPLDASAAAIAAAGMLLLAKMLERTHQRAAAALWKTRGKALIEALSEHCLYREMGKFGIIEKVTVDRPRNSGVNESSMYGDYYFMEAIHRYITFDDEEASAMLY